MIQSLRRTISASILSAGVGLLAMQCLAQERAPSAKAQPAHADNAATADPKSTTTTRLILLGTNGGPVDRQYRSQTASVVEVNGEAYLIDIGAGVTRQLVGAGIGLRQINTVFLTHLHFDHVAGLAPFMGFLWSGTEAHAVDVYGPPGTDALVRGAVQYLDIPQKLYELIQPPKPTIAEATRWHIVDGSGPTEIFRDRNVRVTAVENSHYATINASRLPASTRSYAYRFDTHDRSIVFTGDTGPSDAVTALARNADILVSEVIDLEEIERFLITGLKMPEGRMMPLIEHMRQEHLTPEEIGKLAAKAGVKMVVLNHLIVGSDGETDFRKYSDGVKKFYDGPVIVGDDLMNF